VPVSEERDPDAHQLAARPLGRLFAAQLGVADRVQRLAQRGRVVAGVIYPAGLALVRELVGVDQVVQAQLGGVDAQLGGEDVYEALDQVDGLGDSERARIGDPAGRLVRIDAADVAVRRRQVV
jgi:hypothetical protein